MRPIYLLLLLLSCSHKGPQIENLVPADRDRTLSGLIASADRFETMIVYGDSLSDPGNLSSNTFQILLPHGIFYKGRFSNGPIWADYVQKATKWNVYNYAVSGARTFEGPFPERLVVSDLPEQIGESQSRLKSLDPERTLISIWIGPNNYLRNGGEFEDTQGKTKSELLRRGVDKSLSDIRKATLSLIDQGFTAFAVGTMPELGGINRSPEEGRTATDATLFEATRLHNSKLKRLIEDLEKQHTDIRIATFQAYEINKATYDSPETYHFTVLNKPCFEGSLKGEFYGKEKFCDDLLGYKFWEYLHPNTMMHCYYASQFLSDLTKEGFLPPSAKDRLIDRCRSLNPKS
jgi:phospholipase/lecithinase/hemolysin